MKRETKAGLVVTASFLILVGGVFGVKYLKGTPEAKTDPAAAAAAKEKAAAGDTIPAPPGFNEPLAPLPSGSGKPTDDPPPGALIPPPSTLLPPAESTPTIKLNPKKPVVAAPNDPAADDPFPPPPPIIRVKHEDKGPPASPMPSGPPMIILPAPSSGPMTPAPLELPKPGMSDPPKIEVPLPMSGPPMPGDTTPKPPPPGELAPLPGSTPPDKPKEKDPPKIDLPKPGDMPPKIDIPKPPVDLPKPSDMPPKIDIPKPPIDLPKPGDMPPKIDIPKPPIDLPKPSDVPKPLDPPGANGPKPPIEFPKTPMGPTPPQEAPANTRPIDNQPEPDVRSYDEEWHYCKQQGESLDSISQKYYFSAKYEQALRRYNLDRNPAPVFQNDKPTLQIGQVVKVPPARILERMYPDAVGGMKSPAPAKPTGAGGANVRPAASLGPVGASGTDTGSAREYTVPRDGMTIKDVARDELGKEDQWHRIFLLNRWVNPSAPLKAGTGLFIPRATTP